MNIVSNNQTNDQKKSRGLSKIIIYIGVVLILVLVVALAMAPSQIRNYLNKNGKELVVRTLKIDKISYNYFTSTLKVEVFMYF